MKCDILAAVADGAMTTHPSRPAGRGSKRRRDTLEFGVKLLFLLCGCVAVGCVLFICIYLIVAGLPAVLEIGITDFLFGTEWAGKQGQFGILPFILTSVAGTAGAVLVGVPVGILTAMFLAKVAPPKAARVIRTAVEGKEGIKAITVGGVPCTEETVLDGSYQIQRPFVMVTRESEALNPAAQAFFDWAVSADAADLIRQAGAVPLA